MVFELPPDNEIRFVTGPICKGMFISNNHTSLEMICIHCIRDAQRTRLQVVRDDLYDRLYAPLHMALERRYWDLYKWLDGEYRWNYHRIFRKWPGE